MARSSPRSSRSASTSRRASSSDDGAADSVFFCAAALYAAAVFWTEATGLPHWWVDVFAVTMAAIMVGRAVYLQGGVARRPWRVVGIVGALCVVAGLFAAVAVSTDWRLMPYLPMALCSVIVAVIFARGLRRGGRPLILQLIEVMGIGPEATPQFRAFARRQSVAWVVMSLIMTGVSLAGMGVESWRGWVDIAMPAFAAFQLGWFVISHNIGMSRYGRPESWRDTLNVMTNVKTWTALEI